MLHLNLFAGEEYYPVHCYWTKDAKLHQISARSADFEVLVYDSRFLAWAWLAKPKVKLSYQKSNLAKTFTEKKRVKVRTAACHYATKKTC